MDIQDFLRKRHKADRINRKVKGLLAIYNRQAFSSVSRDMAHLGIFFLGSHLTTDNRDGKNYTELRRYQLDFAEKVLGEGGKRDRSLKKLLKFLYTKEYDALIYDAWNLIPELPYQRGMDRRSFRTASRSDILLENRYAFMESISRILAYDLNIEESILYNGYVNIYNSRIECLWAAAVRKGDEKIYRLLIDIVYGRHATAKPTRPVIKALLMSDREEAWKAVGDLLLSAQRQEGLRQTIVESLDETTPGALIYFMNLILENNLTRFSSVVRALDVWTGMGWGGEKQKTVTRFLQLGLQFLTHPEQAEETAAGSADNGEIYMALWSIAVRDVDKAVPFVEKLFESGSREKGSLALYFVSQCKLEDLSLRFCARALKENSLPLAAMGISLLSADLQTENDETLDFLFDHLEKWLPEITAKKGKIGMAVFSWLTIPIDPDSAHSILVSLTGKKPWRYLKRLLPYLDKMSLDNRTRLTRNMLPGYGNAYYGEEKKRLSSYQIDYAFAVLNDRADSIRTAAMDALKTVKIEIEQIPLFEEMLKRKSASLRKSVIDIVMKQKKENLALSLDRLLDSASGEQRLAGLDMLNQLYKKKENREMIGEKAGKFLERKNISPKEQILLGNLTGNRSVLTEYREENGFGLFDPNNITAVVDPGKAVEAPRFSRPVKEIEKEIKKLHRLFLDNKDYEYEVENFDGTREKILLGNRFFIKPVRGKNELSYKDIPLGPLWEKWFGESGMTSSDLFLATLSGLQNFDEGHAADFPGLDRILRSALQIPAIPKTEKIYYRLANPLLSILNALLLRFPCDEKAKILGDFHAYVYARLSGRELKKVIDKKTYWYGGPVTVFSHSLLRFFYDAYGECVKSMDDDEFARFWKLESWKNRKISAATGRKAIALAPLESVCRAFELNLITSDELKSRIMTEDGMNTLSKKQFRDHEIKYFEKYPFLTEIYEKTRERILEIELKRGDSSTAVTMEAQNIQSLYGTGNFTAILTALGKDTLARGYFYSWVRTERNKKEVLSTLLKRCYPGEADDQKLFDKAIKESKISDKRLIEAVMYAPQWVDFISSHLKWKGLESAIWWLHAHTNARHDSETEGRIGKFSPVDMLDFKDGAVDIRWFNEAYKKIGPDRWKFLYDAAKYISDGNGHTRAKLYADVILSNIPTEKILERIKDKRNQDYLRVYGLAPLARGSREKQILERYRYLQQFKKESRQFGSQRQASEALAVRIAMENLARTAGYEDPQRLTWSMEKAEAAQILKNAAPLKDGDVEISLIINDEGKPSIAVRNKGKMQKSIPSKFKKTPAVLTMKESVKTLKEQYRRARISLEAAMVSGDGFTAKECRDLMDHPVISPLLGGLVFCDDENIGFFRDGKLIGPNEEEQTAGRKLRIAHCSDLHSRGVWKAYREHCFARGLKQPFKQIFRELYIPTEDELAERTVSRRYAGHQVQPRQTTALLKSRNWTIDRESGLQKVYHRENVIAEIYALADWFSPADVECPTLETVHFFDRNSYKPIPFDKVNPLIFSEVMRDLDLVVSVAHAGETDPEASLSTVEMRSAIAVETAKLFKLNNVAANGSHLVIKGELGEYSIHLGSAVVHKMPGVYLSILPVHSQHRGRLFLPFVDEDPKTAEVVSKMLLLARDDEIKDPTILDQILKGSSI